jgi:hypothetical protein
MFFLSSGNKLFICKWWIILHFCFSLRTLPFETDISINEFNFKFKYVSNVVYWSSHNSLLLCNKIYNILPHLITYCRFPWFTFWVTKLLYLQTISYVRSLNCEICHKNKLFFGGGFILKMCFLLNKLSLFHIIFHFGITTEG